jgi:hypothetical protein
MEATQLIRKFEGENGLDRLPIVALTVSGEILSERGFD